MSALTSPRTYTLLAVMQAGDAVACAIPITPITKAFDDVGLSDRLRPIIPVVKAASAVGLLSVHRFPTLARVTTFMLTVYFVLAIAFHVRAKDWSPGMAAATGFLGLFATMTVKGPSIKV